MRKIILALVVGFFLLAATFGWITRAEGQDSGEEVILKQEKQGENLREVTAPAGTDASVSPDLSYIDSPSATCYQPDPSADKCLINWYYISVDGSPNYMIAMTVTINELGHVAKTDGFFQTSMYIPYNMFGQGFQVTCGPNGAGGVINLGKGYAYTIRARDSLNQSVANYGSVYCPAYVP